jgi:GDP-4-dehydro-6-deoxy-D-mannose reductase
LLAERGEPGGVYNVGSGRAYPVRFLLDTLLDLSTTAVTVVIDPTRLRPSDVPVSVCNNQHLQAATGWQPQIDLRTSLTDLLNYWRRQLQQRK